MFPTARLASQPFVVAGDIMLSKTTDANNVEQLVITRLYDNNRGVFALDSEQLTLLDLSGEGLGPCSAIVIL